MNWIITSLLMFFSSICLYLLVRKATIIKIPTVLINFASFILPLCVYFIIAIKNKEILLLKPNQLITLLVLSIFGSYLPNITSLNSIKIAPNPGYSLIISKSYVIFTTLVAVLLFKSTLNIKSAIAISLIVFFSILVTVDKKNKHNKTSIMWLPLALYSFFGWGFLSIGTKYAFGLGVTIIQRLIFLSLFVNTFIISEMFIRKTKIKQTSLSNLILLLLIGCFSASFNYFMILGLDLAPNIGFVNAINASSISLLTIFSSILFKDHLSLKKLIGVIGVTLGLVLLIM